MSIYAINDLEIKSVIRVPPDCRVGETATYGNLYHYELIYCISGESEINFGGIIKTDRSGTVRYLPARTKHNIYTARNIKDGEWIDIFFETESPLPREMISRNYSSNSNLSQLFTKLHKAWISKSTGYYNKCLSYFFSILSEMEKSDIATRPRAHAKKISAGIEYIHSNYLSPDFDYKHAAELCEVSYTYFKRLFIELYGIPPYEYIKNLRMQNACELLKTGRFSVSAVAELCGYQNVYYFSRVFKENFGVPPSEYRGTSQP